MYIWLSYAIFLNAIPSTKCAPLEKALGGHFCVLGGHCPPLGGHKLENFL